jgi:SAM-dependent methyltransferase
MLDQARRHALANQSFLVGPVQALASMLPAPGDDGAFDVVLSRSALHWVPSTEIGQVYADACRLLRPGGWLRVECGGGGNIPFVVPVLDRISARHGGPQQPWTFSDAGLTLELLERAGFELDAGSYVHTVVQRRQFTRQTFTGWLTSQVLLAYTAGLAAAAADAFRREVVDYVDEMRRHDGSFDQTFVRLDLLVRKPLGSP